MTKICNLLNYKYNDYFTNYNGSSYFSGDWILSAHRYSPRGMKVEDDFVLVCLLTTKRVFSPYSFFKSLWTTFFFLNSKIITTGHLVKLLLCHGVLLSHVRLFATPWIAAARLPCPCRLSEQEYWSGLPCPPAGGLPNPGMEPRWIPYHLSHQGSPS